MTILRQSRMQGLPIPKAIANAPRLRCGLEFFYKAFWDLNHDRDMGMSEGGIRWTAINAYADRYNYDDIDDFERLVDLIRRIDMEYRKYCENNSKTEESNTSTG